jgi:hypothetical protein
LGYSAFDQYKTELAAVFGYRQGGHQFLDVFNAAQNSWASIGALLINDWASNAYVEGSFDRPT